MCPTDGVRYPSRSLAVPIEYQDPRSCLSESPNAGEPYATGTTRHESRLAV